MSIVSKDVDPGTLVVIVFGLLHENTTLLLPGHGVHLKRQHA